MNDVLGDAAWRPRHSAWLIAFVVTLAPFMEILDTTIVNVSLPYIAGDMSASYDDSTWSLTSYLVANGIVLPVAGWLGRLIGRKRYFLLCIAMFTAFSLLCGLATSLPQLVVFRVLQGLFGGGLQPSQQAVVLDTFEPSQRGRAFSIVAIAVIFAPILGPVLGGWLTDTYSWRWVFLINVPVGIVAFVSVASLVDDPPWVARDRTDIRDIDYVGLGLIALGLGCLQVTLDRGEELDWLGSPTIKLFALLAGIGIAGATVWLLLTDKPVVDLRVLGDRNFAVGVVCISCIGAILYSSNLVIPSYAQQVMGYTALLAGEVVSPGSLVMVFLIPVVARLALPNIQTRYLLAFGFFVLGCTALYAHRLTPDLDFTTMATWRAFQTIGLAFLFVPNSTISYSTVPRRLNPDATALYAMFRNISGSIGIAAAAALIDHRERTHRAYLAAHLTPLDRPFADTLDHAEQTLRGLGHTAADAHHAAMGLLMHMLDQQSLVLAYADVFTVSAVAAFAVIPLTFLFRPMRAGPHG
ncbi:MAG TPA: DHA2 family efflux MFS transporter permease subunit [Acetobacteraceae bacterium]|nr:DHA2 family efflux MFS transporter permease subunit [Acetobacteraceae bacterium]